MFLSVSSLGCTNISITVDNFSANGSYKYFAGRGYALRVEVMLYGSGLYGESNNVTTYILICM